jgi:hypothetical protein
MQRFKMADLIRGFIENFGPAPREFSWWQRLTYLRVSKPQWLKQNPEDELMVLFEHLPELFESGTVVWGHIVQANGLMFEEGDFDCPGEVVFSLAEPKKAIPKILESIAHEIFELKGTEPEDPKLARIAEHLTNEMTRVYGLPVPQSLGRGMRCLISTTFLSRKHLPNRRLCSPVLPLVVNPEPPHVAMPLPAKYWPKAFVEWWCD